MAISKMVGKLKTSVKEKCEAKLKKKAKKKLKKLLRKLVCTAAVCFTVVMVYKHRRPIMAAILGKKQPNKKCPSLLVKLVKKAFTKKPILSHLVNR